MKGISPMIAVVLLIAFTVAIGGIISIWMTGLTTTQTQSVSNQTGAQIECTPSLQIDEVKIPSSWGATASVNLANVTVSNIGQKTIASLTLLMPNGTSTNPVSYGSLQAGALTVIPYALGNVTPTYAKVSGLCQSLPVSATCNNNEKCWKT